MKRFKRILGFFSSMRARMGLSALCAVLMLFLTWYSDRSPFSVGNEDVLMRHIYLSEKIMGVPDRRLPADILAVNVGYDRQLVPVCDAFGDTIGERDVVNRYRLRRFLELIKDMDYRAVLVDVFFDGDNPSPGDTALIALINSMDRVTVPRHADRTLSPMIHPSKASSGDYTVNIYENDFVKYLFEQGSEGNSIALQTYLYGLGDDSAYCSRLNQPAMILPLDITLREQTNADGTLEWYNLGRELLSPDAAPTLPNLVKGRTIVIGDYVKRDRHGTYVGEISGPAVHINAIAALQDGMQKINLLEAAAMGIAYMAICLMLAAGMTVWRRFRVPRGSLLEYLLNFISFSVYLVLLEIILYICFGKFHDTFLVALFLSVYTIFCQRLNKEYPL